jgi:hypothetical protein
MFVQMQAFGKVERDPELHITKDGTPFTEFSLAVNISRSTPLLLALIVGLLEKPAVRLVRFQDTQAGCSLLPQEGGYPLLWEKKMARGSCSMTFHSWTRPLNTFC